MKKKVKLREKQYSLSREEVVKRIGTLEPDSVQLYYVQIGEKKFPPKQIIGEIFDLGRAEFTTMDAVSILRQVNIEVRKKNIKRTTKKP